MKTGGRRVKHARYYWLLLAEGHLHCKFFGAMLGRIWALRAPGGYYRGRPGNSQRTRVAEGPRGRVVAKEPSAVVETP